MSSFIAQPTRSDILKDYVAMILVLQLKVTSQIAKYLGKALLSQTNMPAYPTSVFMAQSTRSDIVKDHMALIVQRNECFS
jgi:hypothetical protein